MFELRWLHTTQFWGKPPIEDYGITIKRMIIEKIYYKNVVILLKKKIKLASSAEPESRNLTE